MTTIEKLYYGHIHPHEKLVDPESRFAVLQDLLLSSDEDLKRLLPENGKDAYAAFKAAYDELYAMAETEALICRYREVVLHILYNGRTIQ